MRWNLPDEKLFLFPTEDSTILMFSIDLKPGTIFRTNKWQDDLEKALLEYSPETATNFTFSP
jgi:multidrug efflux pump subunit AcrB